MNKPIEAGQAVMLVPNLQEDTNDQAEAGRLLAEARAEISRLTALLTATEKVSAWRADYIDLMHWLLRPTESADE